METIAVHAHVLALMQKHGAVAPPQWQHDLAGGTLSFRFPESPNTYTWGAETIKAMAAEVGSDSGAAAADELLARWAAVTAILGQAGRPLPDRLLVDHDEDEMTLVWDDEKLVVIIGPDGPDEIR